MVRGGDGRDNIRPRARSGRPCYAPRASPMVPRASGRARTPPHPRRRIFRLAARCLRMESRGGRTCAGILGREGRLTLPGTGCPRECQRSRNLLCHPCTVGRPRTFPKAPVERRTMDAVAGCSRSSLPGTATALPHASTSASAGQGWRPSLDLDFKLRHYLLVTCI